MFSFPNPVNEVAARTVAAGVVVMSLATLLLSLANSGFLWLTVPIAYGFVARVLNGPRWSPLGLFATRIAAPRLGHEKLVAGPPKRFAQGIGAVVTTAAVVLVGVGALGAAQVLLGLMVVFATLESAFALCVGCKAFAGLMRLGLIPEETCEACNNISLRTPQVA
ncbi:MAG: transporter permease [Frankiales bacterium]|nr:transporter permease [Frankiales bacterium]